CRSRRSRSRPNGFPAASHAGSGEAETPDPVGTAGSFCPCDIMELFCSIDPIKSYFSDGLLVVDIMEAVKRSLAAARKPVRVRRKALTFVFSGDADSVGALRCWQVNVRASASCFISDDAVDLVSTTSQRCVSRHPVGVGTLNLLGEVECVNGSG